MKIFTHYNEEGEIKTIITFDGPDHGGVQLPPKPGLFLSAVEEYHFESVKPSSSELQEIMKNYKISHKNKRLTKKH
jgi:hypothetical protein